MAWLLKALRKEGNHVRCGLISRNARSSQPRVQPKHVAVPASLCDFRAACDHVPRPLGPLNRRVSTHSGGSLGLLPILTSWPFS